MNVHVCSFSGCVSRLKPREKRNINKVLAALTNDSRVSTWDMEENNLWKTILILRDNYFVEEITREYPWHEFKVTPAGHEYLKEREDES